MSLYYSSLAPGAPARKDIAPPSVAAPSLGAPLMVGLLGIAAVISGAFLIGLGAVAAAGVWGWVVRQMAEDVARRRAEWESKRICVACSEKWVP
ncbi:hypothetical protein ACIQPQ_31410 [Streptomyces sp. NPDC091281]|uniref:hypothetical protein n=1 Tax=Streptomyces sp. NPDC091281 TaxID=3365985 RepID=UPI00380DACFF